MAKWAWWHQGTGPDEYRIRELLRAIWDLHAMYGADAPWLWRGQANATYNLEPGLHTRIAKHVAVDDAQVETYSTELIKVARTAELDRHEGFVLPDMALLALLQHHGAATPLLDVTLDPIVALYMAVVSPTESDVNEDGVVFAIKRPAKVIDAYDSRTFTDIYSKISANEVTLYSAPDVSERLRIQRGHFLLGRHSVADKRITIPISLDPSSPQKQSWVWKRMAKRGIKSPPPNATTDLAAFRVTAGFKNDIRAWLEDRSGLTKDFVYPTAWHQPHLDRFAMCHCRTASF